MLTHATESLQGGPWFLCSGRLFGDGPDGVDDAGEVAEEGEDKADPELNPAAELEEDPERRQDDGEDDVDAGRRAVRHLAFLSVCSV